MFCSVCGKQSSSAANFCSACGAAAVVPPVAPQARIVRPRSPRMIGGVCAGVAIHYGWNLPLIRVLLCVFTVLSHGLGLLCYIVAWILIPEAPFASPASMAYPGSPAGPPVQTGYQQGQGTGV